MMIGGTCHIGVRTRGGLAGAGVGFQVGVRCDVGVGWEADVVGKVRVGCDNPADSAGAGDDCEGCCGAGLAGNGGGGTDGDAGSGGGAGLVTAGESAVRAGPPAAGGEAGRAGPVVAGGIVVGAVLAISDRGNVAVLAGAGDSPTGVGLDGGDGSGGLGARLAAAGAGDGLGAGLAAADGGDGLGAGLAAADGGGAGTALGAAGG